VLLLLPFLVRSQTNRRHDDLLQWMKDNGGTVHPNLQIRRADPDDPTSRYGIFAKDAITKDETILMIPRKCLVTAGDPDVGDVMSVEVKPDQYRAVKITKVNLDDTYDIRYDSGQSERGVLAEDLFQIYHGAMVCDTVRNLAAEMHKAENSFYAPYVLDLLAQPTDQLPAKWSDSGKAMLRDLLDGDELPPRNIMSASFAKECGGNDSDPVTDNAAMIQLQRAWDDVLVPVLDMLSHRNGRWLNTVNSNIHWAKPVFLQASRKIEKGEEIYTSYNFCSDCDNRNFGYGTPEILRDYGFVEQFPQRWFFPKYEEDKLAFEIDEHPNLPGKYTVKWLHKTVPNEASVEFMEDQVDRLKYLGSTAAYESPGSVPKHEWETIKIYQKALLFTFQTVLAAVKKAKIDPDCSSDNPTCEISSKRYDSLGAKPDFMYNVFTCDSPVSRLRRTTHTKHFGTIETPYQSMRIYQNPDSLDTCFELDKTVQICGSYRPHYHEPMVHYTARFLSDITRVVFVGGGDSMLLHECLKYPNIEIVMGLEIDQTVTRKSFEHFGTQPHWDDDRVQWWFGDAAKSLLMLPKEYYGTFDMVLVDLSETVMSISVTEGLDIMGALSLLLKPDGILVKNELYMNQMSEIFEYSMQMHYHDVPVLCSQAMVLGSDGNNLLKAMHKDHGVATLMEKHIDPIPGGSGIPEFTDLWHDFRRNATFQKSPNGLEQIEAIPEEQQSSPGILMILEAEETDPSLLSMSQLREAVMKATTATGLNVRSAQSKSAAEGNIMTLVLDEGYVVARAWPGKRYIAFDVHLWTALETQEVLRGALLAAVGSDKAPRASSSYRIVAGGIFGLDSWKDDLKKRGPKDVTPGQSLKDSDRSLALEENSWDAVLSLAMSIAVGDHINVVVACGLKSQPCPSVQAVDSSGKVAQVSRVDKCDSLEGINEFSPDATEKLFECEKEVLSQLKRVAGSKRFTVVILDSNASFSMAQIMNKIFSSASNRRMFLTSSALIVAPDSIHEWQKNFLDRFRREFTEVEPVYLVQASINSTESTFQLAMTSIGDVALIDKVRMFVDSVEKELGLVVDVRDILGGLFRFRDDYKPRVYLPGDYDQSAPLEQWQSQVPLGRQTVYQMELQPVYRVGDRIILDSFSGKISKVNNDGSYNIKYDDGDFDSFINFNEIKKDDPNKADKYDLLKSKDIIDALRQALTYTGAQSMKDAEIELFDDIGNGAVAVTVWPQGNIVALWDGNLHVDLNIFTYSQSENLHLTLQEYFLSEIPNLVTVLHDKQPRGYGRVVNFAADIVESVKPHWA